MYQTIITARNFELRQTKVGSKSMRGEDVVARKQRGERGERGVVAGVEKGWGWSLS